MSERKISNFRATPNAVKAARKRKLRARRMIVKGSLVAITTGLVTLGIVGCKTFLDKSDEKPIDVSINTEEPYAIDISAEDLSSLNVVLVNDGISSEMIDQAAEDLNDKGLECEVRNIDEFYKDGTECFVSFTSYNGSGYKVDASYESGNSHADLLALGMAAEFTGGDMQKGVYDTTSAYPNLIPSNIEKAVDGQKMPHVTIAVSTDTPSIDTEKLIDGLARYNDALKNISSLDRKFLLRPGSIDSEDYQSSLDPDVLSANGLDSSYDVKQDSILRNKWLPKSFDKDAVITVDLVNTKGSSLT